MLSSYYNTLLSLQVTVFGISVAAVFVYLQLVYGSYSYRSISFIFRTRILLAYISFSLAGIIFTSVASYAISYTHHDIIPQLDFNLTDLFSSGYLGIISLAFVLLSLLLFIILSFYFSRYLRPTTFLQSIQKNMNYGDIRCFLLDRYGVPDPTTPWFQAVSILSQDKIEKYDRYITNKGDLTPEEIKEIENENVKKAITQERQRSAYTSLTKQVSNSPNPFELLLSIAEKSVRSGDYATLRNFRDSVEVLTTSFLENYTVGRKYKNDSWDPDSNLCGYYQAFFVQSLELLVELAVNNHSKNAASIIYEASQRIAELFVENKHYNDLAELLVFWKNLADSCIESHNPLFVNIMYGYRKIGEMLFTDHSENDLDGVFRDLGWLGERLIPSYDFTNQPIMPNYDYTSFFGAYYNTLLSFDSAYRNNKPDWYPLVYFDAISVVAKPLIQKKKELSKREGISADLSHWLYDLAWVYSSFAESAIPIGNSRGASLAVMRLHELYKEYELAGLDKLAGDTIQLMVSVGALAAAHSDKQKVVEFMGEGIPDWIKNKLSQSKYREAIQREVKEVYIKLSTGGDRDKVWEYITDLGKWLQTNFGFMFDWQNGKTYSADDPRRQ